VTNIRTGNSVNPSSAATARRCPSLRDQKFRCRASDRGQLPRAKRFAYDGRGGTMHILEVSTDSGGIEIHEDELATITDAELKKLRMSREVLERCFRLGKELMKGKKPGDRVRPCADEDLQGNWHVVLVRYSELSDPLMNVRRRRSKPN
jgi:hypothetical protein